MYSASSLACRDVVIEIVPLFQQSATSSGWTVALALTTYPTLTYDSKKLLVHSSGHTPGHRVGSRAELSEGSTQIPLV